MQLYVKDVHSPSGKTKIFIDKEDYLKFKKHSIFIVRHYPNTESERLSVRTYKDKKLYELSRLIMNPDKGLQVDHINRNRLDNRKENLRVVSRSVNMRNRTVAIPLTGFNCIYESASGFRIVFSHDNIRYNLDGYNTATQANDALRDLQEMLCVS
jgi:hypothetical protein